MKYKWIKRKLRVLLIFLHISGRKRVFILTFQWGANYGQQLQNYALAEKIKSLGFYPKTIAWWKDYYKNPLGLGRKNLDAFRKKYIFSTNPIFTEKQLKETIKEGNRIIIGGDQCFRNWYGSNNYMPVLRFYGDFISGKWVIASYAASFGTDYYWGNEYLINESKKLLIRFDKISVRERSGVEILKNTFGIDGIEVLDPVFLIPDSKYYDLVKNYKNLDTSNGYGYIAYMCLDLPELSNEFVERFKYNRVVNIYFDKSGQYNTVEQWLYNLMQSKFVITDSFHCTVFSIIFKKPFVVIYTKIRGNARIQNLLETFNLQGCIRETLSDINEDDFKKFIDWDNIESIIRKRLIVSENYLKEVLSIKPSYKKPYINWPLRGIRARYERAYYYRKNAEISLKKAQISLEYKFGLRHKILRMIIKCLVDRKKYLKLKRNHTLFFQDSKSQFIQFLGRFYN